MPFHAKSYIKNMFIRLWCISDGDREVVRVPSPPHLAARERPPFTKMCFVGGLTVAIHSKRHSPNGKCPCLRKVKLFRCRSKYLKEKYWKYVLLYFYHYKFYEAKKQTPSFTYFILKALFSYRMCLIFFVNASL
jgi:hypothetical protein